MNEFSISKPALAEIRRLFRESECRDPIARLYDVARPGPLFDEFKTDLLAGKRSREELESTGKKRFEEVGEQLVFSLMVDVGERKELRPEDLFEVSGITLGLGAGIHKLLREYHLTFEGGRFALRGPDNVAHTLRSFLEAEFNKSLRPDERNPGSTS